MNKAKVVGWLTVAILLTATMTGCGSSEPEVTQPQYTTVPVKHGDVIRTVYAPGELVPIDTLALSSPVDSELLELRVKPGEKVNKGDILAHLDKEPFKEAYEDAVAQAEDDLEAAESDLKSDKQNRESSEHNLRAALHNLKSAQYNLEIAEYNYEQAQQDDDNGNDLYHLWIAVQLAQERVYLAEDEVDVAQEGVDVTWDKVNTVKDEVDAAEEALEQAKEDNKKLLNAADILAPCDGTVLDIKFAEGDIVTEDSPIIVLADLSQMELMTTVGQDKITSIRPGISADIILDALPGTTLKGKVDYVMPQKSPTSQTVTYEVYLSIDETTGNLLPSMTGGATILVAEKHDVLRVSRRLVKIAPDGSGRVEVLEQGQPVVREVVIGVRGDSYYEIVSGLSEGDLVIQRGRF